MEKQTVISNPELHYQPTFLNSMWFDDATGAILESGCGPWGIILGNWTHWEENVKFLPTKHIFSVTQALRPISCTIYQL